MSNTTSWGGIPYSRDYYIELAELQDFEIVNQLLAYAIAESESTIEYYVSVADTEGYFSESDACSYGDLTRDIAYSDMVDDITETFQKANRLDSVQSVNDLYKSKFKNITLLTPYVFEELMEEILSNIGLVVDLEPWG
jgi:hypothetical protein